MLFARALAQRPALLILDEPTNHLDVRHQLQVLEAARRLGVSVVTTLHDLNLAARWCDRLALLDAGRIVATGTPDAVLTPALIGRVYGVTVERDRDPAPASRGCPTTSTLRKRKEGSSPMPVRSLLAFFSSLAALGTAAHAQQYPVEVSPASIACDSTGRRSGRWSTTSTWRKP